VYKRRLLAGARVTAPERFNPARAIEIVERDGVTVLVGVPAVFGALVAVLERRGAPLRADALRLCICGGAPLPVGLLGNLLGARNFQSGMAMVRQLEFALFDFRLHREWGTGRFDTVQHLLDEVRCEVAVVKPPSCNRFQNSFTHIFSGGYAAGYYSYKWAEVLSADAFSRFEAEGVFNAETGAAFRTHILETGGSREPMESFVAFRGREPSIEPLLRHSGIRG